MGLLVLGVKPALASKSRFWNGRITESGARNPENRTCDQLVLFCFCRLPLDHIYVVSTRIADFDFGSDKPPDIIRNFILVPFEALFDFGDDRVGRKNDSIGMDGWLSKDEDNCHSP